MTIDLRNKNGNSKFVMSCCAVKTPQNYKMAFPCRCAQMAAEIVKISRKQEIIREFARGIISDPRVPESGKQELDFRVGNLENQLHTLAENARYFTCAASPGGGGVGGGGVNDQTLETQIRKFSSAQRRFLHFRALTLNLTSGNLQRVWNAFERVSSVSEDVNRKDLIFSLENLGVRHHLEQYIFHEDPNWQLVAVHYWIFMVENEALQQDICEKTLLRIRELRNSKNRAVEQLTCALRERIQEYLEIYGSQQEARRPQWLTSFSFDTDYAESLARVLPAITTRLDEILEIRRQFQDLLICDPASSISLANVLTTCASIETNTKNTPSKAPPNTDTGDKSQWKVVEGRLYIVG